MPVVTGTYCVVPEFNMNAVSVIGNIMAQTVALDTYSDTVDALLAEFASINSAVNDLGNFEDSKKSHLFKVVAHNNSIFIDMISKLGIKDRSDDAWNLRLHLRMGRSYTNHDVWLDSTLDESCILVTLPLVKLVRVQICTNAVAFQAVPGFGGSLVAGSHASEVEPCLS